MDVIDVAVVGGGPAGHTAALYARRAGRSVTLIQGEVPGGQLTTTSHVENWPGDKTIPGPDLMVRMLEQVEELGVDVIYDYVTEAQTDGDGLHALTTDLSGNVRARTVILCTGAQALWLGAEGEERLKNAGISGCATCDGPFFAGQDVVVVGGGNTAVEEAIYLSDLCRKVTVVHRRDRFRAEAILVDRLRARDTIEVLFNRTVKAFGGEGKLEFVDLASTNGAGDLRVPAQGAFVAIGHKPATDAFTDWIECDADGYVRTHGVGGTLTSRQGVFAAGDVADKIYRQAITSAGAGCMAALDADRFLSEGA
ncbi:MAG: FAD-dependent oxidoreductase [Devosiaceae bacterium]|nr:FAD-dependent oxidoreductase [Devosiaceae bacterium MH13]